MRCCGNSHSRPTFIGHMKHYDRASTCCPKPRTALQGYIPPPYPQMCFTGHHGIPHFYNEPCLCSPYKRSYNPYYKYKDIHGFAHRYKDGPTSTRYGMRKIVKEITNPGGGSTTKFFEDGGMAVVQKAFFVGYEPKDNGDKFIGCQWGIDAHPDSEGMDCINYRYNARNPRLG